MITNRLSLTLVLAVVALTGTGCGGGGGSSDSDDDQPPPQTVISLTTSEIRTYQKGDTFTASLVFRETSTGEMFTGDITVTIGDIVKNKFGKDCRSIVNSGTLTGPSGDVPYQVTSLFFQDVNNSVYNCGESNENLNGYVFLTNAPDGLFLEKRSPIQLGDSTSGVAFFDDGTWQDCTETVLSIENVSIPLGLYEAYKIAQSCSYSNGTDLVNNIWIVPEIFDIKEIGNLSGVLDIELVLVSFNLN